MTNLVIYQAAKLLNQHLHGIPGVLAVYPDRDASGKQRLRIELFEPDSSRISSPHYSPDLAVSLSPAARTSRLERIEDLRQSVPSLKSIPFAFSMGALRHPTIPTGPRDRFVQPAAISEGSSDPECDERLVDFDWVALHNASSGDPRDMPELAYDRVDQVLVMQDDGLFVVREKALFNVVYLCRQISLNIGQAFDFIAFFAQQDPALPPPERFPTAAPFSHAVFNETRGVNHPGGSNLDQRADYQCQDLRAFNFFSGVPVRIPTVRTLLHEFAHSWCSYVRYKDPEGEEIKFDLLGSNTGQGLYHWNSRFDDATSPMDYDLRNWLKDSAGQRWWKRVSDDEFRYCNLDLYLLGFLPPDEVGPIVLLRNIAPTLATDFEGPYEAAEQVISINDIINLEGVREPTFANAPKRFRQLFVVLCQDLGRGKQFAQEINELRKRYENAFALATRGVAEVTTAMNPARHQ
jgi:hypothetical protein